MEVLQRALINGFDESSVKLLDQATGALYGIGGRPESNKEIQGSLTAVKNHPQAWRHVQTILQYSQSDYTRYFALSILTTAIQTRWETIPEQERNFLPGYLTNLSMTAAKSPNSTSEIKTKINSAIIETVRKTWPQKWPNFISEVCAAAQTDQKVCENNLHLLFMLGEDILDFGRDEMTGRKFRTLASQLDSEFKTIFDLCLFVLTEYKKAPQTVAPALVLRTLDCMALFIKWNSVESIFAVDLPNFLLENFWENGQYRSSCVRCCSEIFAKSGESDRMREFWVRFLRNVSSLPTQYDSRGPADLRTLLEGLFQSICLACCLFCELHFETIVDSSGSLVEDSLNFMVQLTRLPGEEAFKIMVEFWHNFCFKLYNGTRWYNRHDDITGSRKFLVQLNSVRRILIERMARPPEVYLYYDADSGSVDRDFQPDTEEIELYNLLRGTLVILTHLGPCQTETIMKGILNEATASAQREDPSNESWNPMILNRVCWAIGSVSGAFPQQVEKSFLVHVLKNLLWFCEAKRGKGNKAIVASMVMYVYSQYPKFLMENDSLLRVVVKKTMDFMIETFPGVQEMACEAFFKIAKVVNQEMCKVIDTAPDITIIQTIILNLPQLSSRMHSIKQTLLLYNSVAIVVNSAPDLTLKAQLLNGVLMSLNEDWSSCVQILSQNESNLFSIPLQILQKTTEVVQIFERICEAVGIAFNHQFRLIYGSMLRVYELFGNGLESLISAGLEKKISDANSRQMRSCRRSILRLLDTFIRSINQPVPDEILSPLLSAVYNDYQKLTPSIRDPEILTLATGLIDKVESYFEIVFGSIYMPSLEMIKNSFDTFPETRVELFKFLKQTVEAKFQYLIIQPANLIQCVVQALTFAMQHEKPDIAEIGLTTLIDLFRKIRIESNIINFAELIYLDVLTELIRVLTDTLHSAGFVEQCILLQELIIWAEYMTQTSPPSPIQQNQIIEHLNGLLLSTFPNLNKSQVEIFIVRAFSLTHEDQEKFAENVKDLKVQLKEIAGQDSLYELERQETLQQAEKQRKILLSQIPGYVIG